MVKTIRGLIPRLSGTALTLTFGVFLAVSLLLSQPLAAQQFDSCKGEPSTAKPRTILRTW